MLIRVGSCSFVVEPHRSGLVKNSQILSEIYDLQLGMITSPGGAASSEDAAHPALRSGDPVYREPGREGVRWQPKREGWFPRRP